MKEILETINKDINRCNDILKENNYLEIVIAVEELIDKYKNSINNIVVHNDRVWNYSKKDLEEIRDKLVLYKKEHIGELTFKSARSNLIQSSDISTSKLQEVKIIIDDLEKIYYENIDTSDKWEKLRYYINWISKEDITIATNILEIVHIVLK